MAMELRALFLLPLCFPGLQGQAPEPQRRREGDTLNIQCPYSAQINGWDTKLWCVVIGRGCKELVQTYYNDMRESRDGRIKIQDDSARRTVSVTMTDLKAEDSGTYQCVHYYSGLVLKKISLNVFKELLRWELDSVAVQCPYGNGMAWCRRGQMGCTVLAETDTSSRRSGMKSLPGRASIEYNAQLETLTVTMKKLKSQDSGVYWCALGPERTRRLEVLLTVFRRTQQRTAEELGNVSVQCHYKVADYGKISKAWCKKEEGGTCNVLVTTSSGPPAEHSLAREGVSIQDDSQQGVVTVTMEQLRVQDSGVYWCALQELSGLSCIQEVTLDVSKALPPGGFPDTGSRNEEILLGDSPEPSSNENTFLILALVLLFLLLVALVTSIALGLRYSRLLGTTAHRGAEDTSDRPEGTAQPGSSGRGESSQRDSKGSAYINLDVKPQASPEDPLYCNVEPSQAHRKPQHVEYAVIAFNPSPRNDRE